MLLFTDTQPSRRRILPCTALRMTGVIIQNILSDRSRFYPIPFPSESSPHGENYIDRTIRARLMCLAMNKELSTAEVAEIFGVVQRSVRDWCARGLFPNAYEQQTRRGPIWMIPQKDLEGFTPPKMGRPRTRNIIAEKAA